MRIAYVEDNPTNLALVERVAKMSQHIIVSYTEGEEAMVELMREKFALILMDVELAGDVGGLQVVRSVRSQGLKTPIVAVTAYAMLGDRDKCIEAGCDDYLPKPLPIPQLVALLARYEEQAQAIRAGGTAVAVPATPVAAPTVAVTPETPAPVVAEPAAQPVSPAPTENIVPAPTTATPAASPEPTAAPVAPVSPAPENNTPAPEPTTAPVAPTASPDPVPAIPAVPVVPVDTTTTSATTAPVAPITPIPAPISQPATPPEPKASTENTAVVNPVSPASPAIEVKPSTPSEANTEVKENKETKETPEVKPELLPTPATESAAKGSEAPSNAAKQDDHKF